MLCGDADLVPRANDVVLFGADGFQQFKGSFREPFVLVVLAVGEEHWRNGVDDEQIDGTFRQCAVGRAFAGVLWSFFEVRVFGFVAFFGLLPEGVAVVPIGQGVGVEQSEHFRVRSGFSYFRKI